MRTAKQKPTVAGTAQFQGLAHPDAHIIDLAAEFAALVEAREALERPYYTRVDSRMSPKDQALSRKQTRLHFEIHAKLGTARATTVEGYRAKAAVLMDRFAVRDKENGPDPESDNYLAWSLCRDLLAAVLA